MKYLSLATTTVLLSLVIIISINYNSVITRDYMNTIESLKSEFKNIESKLSELNQKLIAPNLTVFQQIAKSLGENQISYVSNVTFIEHLGTLGSLSTFVNFYIESRISVNILFPNPTINDIALSNWSSGTNSSLKQLFGIKKTLLVTTKNLLVNIYGYSKFLGYWDSVVDYQNIEAITAQILTWLREV